MTDFCLQESTIVSLWFKKKKQTVPVKMQTGKSHNSLQHSGIGNQHSRGWWRGLASEIYNADFLSTLLCVFLFGHRVYTDDCAYSISEIGRGKNKKLLYAHTIALLFFHPFFRSYFPSFCETPEFLNYLNDNIQQKLIICIHLYSNSIFLKISLLRLNFLMSLHRFCLGWDIRQDRQWSIWGIKLLLAFLNKQRSRRVAAGLVFGVTHTVYTTGVFVWHHNEFPNGVCVTAGNS